MWKETELDGGLISSRDRDMIADLVHEYLIENVSGYEPENDFMFEVKIEYVSTQESTDE